MPGEGQLRKESHIIGNKSDKLYISYNGKKCPKIVRVEEETTAFRCYPFPTTASSSLTLSLQVLDAHSRRLRGHGLLARLLPLRPDVEEQAAAALAVGGLQGARPPLQEEPQVALPSPPHKLHPRRLELLQAHHQVPSERHPKLNFPPPSSLSPPESRPSTPRYFSRVQ